MAVLIYATWTFMAVCSCRNASKFILSIFFPRFWYILCCWLLSVSSIPLLTPRDKSSNYLSSRIGEAGWMLSSASKKYSSVWLIIAFNTVISGDNGKCSGGGVGDLGDGGAVVAAGVGGSFSNVLLRTTALG
jgi:hypothetical protein